MNSRYYPIDRSVPAMRRQFPGSGVFSVFSGLGAGPLLPIDRSVPAMRRQFPGSGVFSVFSGLGSARGLPIDYQMPAMQRVWKGNGVFGDSAVAADPSAITPVPTAGSGQAMTPPVQDVTAMGTGVAAAASVAFLVLDTASMAASAYHGYRRHSKGKHPILWSLAWGACGAFFPVITPIIALAEGFGQPLPASG